MKIKKIVTKTEELDIVGATLLSIEDVENLSDRFLVYPKWYWLRSPGSYQRYAAGVCPDGDVDRVGDCVGVCAVIRPALKIKNLDKSNCKIGDKFIFGGKEFEIVSNTIAFCLSDIGSNFFRCDYNADDANVYDKSDVKKFVDLWFEEISEDND